MPPQSDPSQNNDKIPITGDRARSIFEELCETRATAILATPYLRYATRFVRLEGKDLLIQATMNKEAAGFALKGTDLKLRFDWNLYFHSALVKILDYEISGNHRYLRLDCPTTLVEDEARRSFRNDRPGRIFISLADDKYELFQATVENVGLHGLGCILLKGSDTEKIRPGESLQIGLTLPIPLSIHTRAAIRYLDGYRFGLEFQPPLEGGAASALRKWIKQSYDEALLRRSKQHIKSTQLTQEAQETVGIALFTGESSLEILVRKAFEGVESLSVGPLNMQSFKKLMTGNPKLVLFHVPNASLDTRHRIQSFLKALPPKLPFVLLSTDLPAGSLFEMNQELKAEGAVQVSEVKLPLLRRMVQGILERIEKARKASDLKTAPETTPEMPEESSIKE